MTFVILRGKHFARDPTPNLPKLKGPREGAFDLHLRHKRRGRAVSNYVPEVKETVVIGNGTRVVGKLTVLPEPVLLS